MHMALRHSTVHAHSDKYLLEVLVPTKARPLVVRDGVKQTYRALAREYFSLCSRMAQKF